MRQHYAFGGKPGPYLHLQQIQIAEAQELITNISVVSEARVSLAWRPAGAHQRLNVSRTDYCSGCLSRLVVQEPCAAC